MFVIQVVTYEYRSSTEKGGLQHVLGDGRTLVDACRFHFDHALSPLQFESAADLADKLRQQPMHIGGHV